MTPADGPTDDEIGEYVDGGLSEQRRAEIEAWLLAHADRRAEVERLQRLNEALKGLGAGILEEPVPDRLRHVLRPAEPGSGGGTPGGKTAASEREEASRNRRSCPSEAKRERPARKPSRARSWPRFVEAAAVLVVFVLGGTLGWSLKTYLDRGRSQIDQVLADASRAFSIYAADPNFPIEFPAGDAEAFERVASRLFQRAIVPPDLESVGYRYLGARLVPTGRIISTLFLFEAADGRRVTILFWPLARSSAMGSGSFDVAGLFATFWLLEGFGVALIGEEGNGHLPQISSTVEAFYREALASDAG